MAGAKQSKNNPANKKESQKVNLVLSSVCEACNTPCEKGRSYIQRLKSGKAGTGVVCKK